MMLNKKLIASAAAMAALLLGGVTGYNGLEGGEKNGGVYRDVAGVLTDCHGNTKNVRVDFVRSDAECKALLNGETQRIGEFIFPKLKTAPSVKTLAAMISFTYNVGDNGFAGSSVLRLWNQGDYEGSCYAMHAWNKIKQWYVENGVRKYRLVVSNGLVNRRKVEYALCMEGLL